MAKALSSLAAGALVKDTGTLYNGKAIVWKIADKNHAGYPANSVTLITERIISLKCFDAKESGNSDGNRKSYGNNRWIYANIRQWLNSQAAAGQWYSAQHGQDAPPSNANVWDNYNEYQQEAGFLAGFSANFLAALLTTLQEGDVLFIDEIHRLSRQVEEVLYPALEDYALDIMIGKGPSAQSIRINLPRFTLVGATTRAGQITGPLRDRFGVLLKLELYSPDELSRIIQRSAGILDQPITPEGAYELAKCSRGTPRVANRFLKRVRDFATVLGDGIIDRDVSLMSLKRMDVDALGLDELDRSLLRAIIEMYNGGPVGLETLAAALGEEAVTLEDLCEPYLMQMGFLTRTPRGRCATRLAYEHLGLKAPETGSPEDNGQQSLF